MGIIGLDPVLGIGGDQGMDIVGEILTADEAFESVGDKGFGQPEGGGESGMDGDSLTGETGTSVENDFG